MKKCIDWKSMVSWLQWSAFLLMAVLLAMASGYATAQQPMKKGASPAGEPNVLQQEGAPAPSAKTYTVAQREAYQQKVAFDLNQMQTKIDGLKIKSRTVVQQKKRMAIKALIELQNMADAARRKLTGLKTAPEKDWGRLKMEMDKSMADLDTAYQVVKAHLY